MKRQVEDIIEEIIYDIVFIECYKTVNLRYVYFLYYVNIYFINVIKDTTPIKVPPIP